MIIAVSILAAILAIAEHFELMLHDLKIVRHDRLIHRTMRNWICLAALQADQMMMMVMLPAVKLEADALFEDDLFQHAEFFHYAQIPVYGIEAETGIDAPHIFIDVLR